MTLVSLSMSCWNTPIGSERDGRTGSQNVEIES